MNDFGILFHQGAKAIFSNSTISKIACFVALRRFRFVLLTLSFLFVCCQCSMHSFNLKKKSPSN